ncbi:MAG TPA: DUF3039 domain-containing protein [Acidimicrobiales bacterium]|nr:DUF3039 domain-containing protein [Acidimicrobiales bacterium]
MTEVASDVVAPVVDGEDDDELAHYARNDELVAARKAGRAVKALCGTLFHPHADPSRLPVCVVCQELAANWNR